MRRNLVVSRDEWQESRIKLLEMEKEFTRLRDELSAKRQSMPWVKIEKEYTFDGMNGAETLYDLFGQSSQLVVYHFMFDPEWEAGCKVCSFWADNFSGGVPHMAARDVSMVAVSRAPVAKLSAFNEQMGWNFKWVSSGESGFNYDFGVSFTPEMIEEGTGWYNYRRHEDAGEFPGLSVFVRSEDGTIYHSYSAYSRGLDIINGAYHLLDMVPKGRDEANLPWSMAWLKYRDQYDLATEGANYNE